MSSLENRDEVQYRPINANFDMNQEFNLPQKPQKHSQRPFSTQNISSSDFRLLSVDKPIFNETVVNMLFVVVLFMNVLINIDHGVMPAGSIVIKDDLDINNTEYGLLGSIVFIGLTIGSIAATYLFQNYNTKYTLMTIMTLNGLSQAIFTMTKHYLLLCLSRFLTGFFQVFVSIYYVVWADMFGSTDQKKQVWLTVLLLSSTLGVLLGYIMTT